MEDWNQYVLDFAYDLVPRKKKDCAQFHSYYFDAAFDQDALLDRARNDLSGVECDTFVGTGLSGATVVPVLAHELGKKFAIARKSREGSHSYNMVEGKIGKRWVMVDDFVSTGKTASLVRDRVTTACKNRQWGTERVGSWLYEREGWVPCSGTPACGCLVCARVTSYRAYDLASDSVVADLTAVA